MSEEPVVRNISDTARWVAVYRARENERKDALILDPFARRLAGERGEYIAKTFKHIDNNYWAFITRTFLFDQIISEQVSQGVDMVINLAAGLDARPYRMNLPSTLKWIEIDLPELLAYKEDILKNEKPVCALQRIPLNLADVTARRTIFEKLKREASKILIITEGLLIYLTEEEIQALAGDLAAAESFKRWVMDIVSPGLLRYIQKQIGKQLQEANAPLKFAPVEGPDIFAKFGWPPIEVRTLLQTAAKEKRVSFWLRILALLPDTKGRRAGNRPWSGVCLMGRN